MPIAPRFYQRNDATQAVIIPLIYKKTEIEQTQSYVLYLIYVFVPMNIMWTFFQPHAFIYFFFILQ